MNWRSIIGLNFQIILLGIFQSGIDLCFLVLMDDLQCLINTVMYSGSV